MRSTQPLQSGMPTGSKYMGWWGSMGGPKQKGITSYTVSPFQQNAMHGAFRNYAFYGYKRIVAQAPYFAIPFAIGYGIYSWGSKRNAFLNSKEGHRLHGGEE
ncbi:putative ubiquinol-cytochrome c reductase complex 11 kda protein [Acaromyces ingoldii]|uniref:Cytochrome b-c1 complex subunit 8 n=1 Tax=Acaromyces ingoldii TaxID=215250 RepID=A0A316YNN5_9BASI|nr:putative ubiquinol-cytochrome c reductase complex 11 kda protein [Acaromyces ingoldii]PWN89663.1 putative ubiquinol-cytochrome c reductase complex 11 kda protein [Acaromyces ingoldii]